jgi:Fe-Mn family superoxide dismutase
MKGISRREAVSRIATGTAGLGLLAASGELVTANQSSTAEATPSRAFRGQHQPRPLPFDPARLKGLSEKLIRSHWENDSLRCSKKKICRRSCMEI